MRYLLCISLLAVLTGCRGRSFRASSAAMEETIHAGELMWVTKSTRFSRNEIAVFDFYGPDNFHFGADADSIPYHWEKRVYRIIAVSGDSIEIKQGQVFVNGEEVPLVTSALGSFLVSAKGPVEGLSKDPDDPALVVSQNKDSVVYLADLTVSQAELISRRKPYVYSVKPYYLSNPVPAAAAAAGHHQVDWYGPFRIPQPGETINIDDSNRRFYQQLPGVHDGPCKIPEKLYFLLGDNRHGAMDSRYIGVIPQSNMYGIVK